MNIFDVIILALVQGITEFVPVSSSGHLAIIEKLLGTNSSTTFDIILHGGTLLALLIFSIQRIKSYFSPDTHENRISIPNILIISAPIIILGGVITILNKLFDDRADTALSNTLLISFNLAFGGILFIFIDNFKKKISINKLDFKKSLIIGLFQCLSLMRGSSRSGSTITGAMITGLDKKDSTDLAFFVGILPVGIAFLFELLKLVVDYNIDVPILYLVLGFIISFISGSLAIRLMISLINKIGLKYFGFYRIALAIIILVFWIL